MTTPVTVNEDHYGLKDVQDHLPQVVEKARQTKRPMIIAEQDRALAAIVDIDELQRLYDLEQSAEDRAVVREFQEAEARGEITWLTTEEIEAFDRQLIAQVEAQATGHGTPHRA